MHQHSPLYFRQYKEINMINGKFIFFASLIFLTGCSKSILDNEDIRCPFVERGGCQSMESINQMIIQKRYTADGLYVQDNREQRFQDEK